MISFSCKVNEPSNVQVVYCTSNTLLRTSKLSIDLGLINQEEIPIIQDYFHGFHLHSQIGFLECDEVIFQNKVKTTNTRTIFLLPIKGNIFQDRDIVKSNILRLFKKLDTTVIPKLEKGENYAWKKDNIIDAIFPGRYFIQDEPQMKEDLKSLLSRSEVNYRFIGAEE